MKKVFAFLILTVMVLSLVACGSGKDTTGDNSSESTQPSSQGSSETPTSSAPSILDLSGGWKQENSNSKTNYQIAMIAENTIEIYWKNEEDNSTSLYWAGTYVAPNSETTKYSWDSVNDKSKTDNALLASGDDKKTFTYENGVISYSVSLMGTTATVKISRSDDVNIQVSKTVLLDDLLPLELVESGYAIKKGTDKYYIQYAVIVKNPNAEKGVRFPKVRITARDSSGAILGTDDIVGKEILPNGTWYSAFQGPSADSEPASVDFEVIQPDSSDWVLQDLLDNAGKPLTVVNPIKRDDKIVGEIVNPNNFEINGVAVVVLFRDNSGKLLAGETTYTDKLAANGKIPFELSLWGSGDYITDKFEVDAYPWY